MIDADNLPPVASINVIEPDLRNMLIGRKAWAKSYADRLKTRRHLENEKSPAEERIEIIKKELERVQRLLEAEKQKAKSEKVGVKKEWTD